MRQLIEIGMLCAPCAGTIMQLPKGARIDCRSISILKEVPMTDARPHHVVVKIDRDRFRTKLREIEAWLAEWEVDAEVGSVLGEKAELRVRFADTRAVYAFQRCHGGRAVRADEIAAAKITDATDEDLYDQLARDYPD
ncbi:hypothetical protein B5U98_26950 [Bosea sp. Tri-39]|nr:hypothetical protein BLM15_29150 [Bosea sp. Tri-49]RXT16803.1 hypothetical protein B5U98_26950 [Bosea sp. Tri-39]RXT37707.1 hypothetical protein B5U99_12225 [Bosea sp. Tri-54]